MEQMKKILPPYSFILACSFIKYVVQSTLDSEIGVGQEVAEKFLHGI